MPLATRHLTRHLTLVRRTKRLAFTSSAVDRRPPVPGDKVIYDAGRGRGDRVATVESVGPRWIEVSYIAAAQELGVRKWRRRAARFRRRIPRSSLRWATGGYHLQELQ